MKRNPSQSPIRRQIRNHLLGDFQQNPWTARNKSENAKRGEKGPRCAQRHSFCNLALFAHRLTFFTSTHGHTIYKEPISSHRLSLSYTHSHTKRTGTGRFLFIGFFLAKRRPSKSRFLQGKNRFRKTTSRQENLGEKKGLQPLCADRWVLSLGH